MGNPARNICFHFHKNVSSERGKNGGREGANTNIQKRNARTISTISIGSSERGEKKNGGREGVNTNIPKRNARASSVLSPQKALACNKRLREWAVSDSIARVDRVSFPSLKSLGKRLDGDKLIIQDFQTAQPVTTEPFLTNRSGPKKQTRACMWEQWWAQQA